MQEVPRTPALRQVALYTADGCSLCGRALEVVREVRAELGFALEVVDIGGDPELEERYRERIPVVEIDGEDVFTYFVDRDALRQRLAVLPAQPGGPLAES